MTLKHQALLMLTFAAALLSGCASVQPHFRVNIDSLSSETAAGKKSYVLLPSNKSTSPDDLQFKEFASYVHRVLSARGFTQAESLEKADIAIFLAYGVGDPQQHSYTYELPVWGQTGVSSSTTFGTLNTYGGVGTYSGTTTYTPTYGVTGYTAQVGTYTTYFRFMLLNAYDLDAYKKDNKLSQVWKTTVTSTGSSGDLRRIFPILVAASKQYLGINTGQKVEISLEETSPEVIEVKGIVTDQTKATK